MRTVLLAMSVACCLVIPVASGCGDDDSSGGDADTDECANGVFEGDCSAETQADLDALAGYTGVDGELVISCPTCSSLAQLACLESISGRLDLHEAVMLMTLEGLDSLATVGEDFLIFDLAVSSLEGLGNLTSVGASLWLHDNDITSLDGIENLDSIAHSLLLSDNNDLENLDGLSGLTSIHGFQITGNASLPYCKVCELFEQFEAVEGPMICEDDLADDCGTTECECP